ncbi:hypothetical protein OSB04_031241 [Centaurea solstitialis]|uniref:Rab-GAP TBC domain-containing protein n=1 Tax=Centaurea solstitialis TaxID=347529 RepID=A0AA38SUB1_9ASTR|nr:hypothetical protein OSB04_031241 [Centaurea solstitialis]
MSPAAPIEPTTKKTLPESSLSGERAADLDKCGCFRDLRGVQWRIDLGILPSSSSSVSDLRRVTANCRRSYAALRRRLLINPQIPKDGSSFPDLVMDNPLSQNPDSMWGRFFHKAELEKMVDQDLSRLYPEHGSYFQSSGCQGVLRRILLLWCIRHQNYGYQQGMHELLAPLLYVLQADLERLSEVRKQYQDYFTDNFDGLSFNESDSAYISDLEKGSSHMEDSIKVHNDLVKDNYLNELDPKIQTIISFSDAYGAEGELGVVLSEKFMEHDAYSMFDALMNGDGGVVAMSNFFSHSSSNGPQNGLPPVLEASSALYHLLSKVDLSLYTHLVELGVEPQYFALRWLRVLFGREFALEDLLVIWDEIFALDNSRLSGGSENESEVSYGVLKSSRGAFISALAVSMILYLRSSVLATENATSCLQRLLNFPEDVNIAKLIKKAKTLMTLAIDAINSKPSSVRGQSLPSDIVAPGSPSNLVPESYWEEKWRVLTKEEEERRQASPHKLVQNRLKGWSEKVKMRLSRTESARLFSKVNHKTMDPSRSPVGENLLDQLGSEEDERLVSEDDSKERFSSVNGGSEENTSVLFDPVSPRCRSINNDHGNETERSSVASTSSIIENYTAGLLYSATEEVASPLPVSDPPEEDMLFKEVQNGCSKEKSVTNLRERRLLAGKFQWLWMFAKTGPAGSLEKASESPPVIENNQVPSSSSSTTDGTTKPEALDHNNMSSLKDVARSMLQHIEVIESVFEQEKAQTDPLEKNDLVGRGQITAMAALKELRKISNLLSET